MDYVYHYRSPLGGVTLASDGEVLTGLWFDGQRYFASTLTGEYREKALPVFASAEEWLKLYFGGRDPGFVPPLRLAGTRFQRAVRELLLEIPYGRTVSYGALAAELGRREGRRTSARAVGGAVGRNPISLIVPCHRVLGAGGALTGYAGGLDRKRALLRLENAGFSDGEPETVCE